MIKQEFILPDARLVLRAAVKRAGGIWRPRQRLWELSWAAVRALDLHGRVVEELSKTKQTPNI